MDSDEKTVDIEILIVTITKTKAKLKNEFSAINNLTWEVPNDSSDSRSDTNSLKLSEHVKSLKII